MFSKIKNKNENILHIVISQFCSSILSTFISWGGNEDCQESKEEKVSSVGPLHPSLLSAPILLAVYLDVPGFSASWITF